MSLSLRKDDLVMVMLGRARGKTGKILKILTERNRALVEKVNLVKRHARPTKASPQGGIIEKEASLHLSNLMFFCSPFSKAILWRSCSLRSYSSRNKQQQSRFS